MKWYSPIGWMYDEMHQCFNTFICYWLRDYRLLRSFFPTSSNKNIVILISRHFRNIQSFLLDDDNGKSSNSVLSYAIKWKFEFE